MATSNLPEELEELKASKVEELSDTDQVSVIDEEPVTAITKAAAKQQIKHPKNRKQRVAAAKQRRAQAAHERKSGERVHATPLHMEKKYSAAFKQEYAVGFTQPERCPHKLGFSNKNWKLYMQNIPIVEFRKEEIRIAETFHSMAQAMMEAIITEGLDQ